MLPWFGLIIIQNVLAPASCLSDFRSSAAGNNDPNRFNATSAEIDAAEKARQLHNSRLDYLRARLQTILSLSFDPANSRPCESMPWDWRWRQEFENVTSCTSTHKMVCWHAGMDTYFIGKSMAVQCKRRGGLAQTELEKMALEMIRTEEEKKIKAKTREDRFRRNFRSNDAISFFWFWMAVVMALSSVSYCTFRRCYERYYGQKILPTTSIQTQPKANSEASAGTPSIAPPMEVDTPASADPPAYTTLAMSPPPTYEDAKRMKEGTAAEVVNV